MSKINTWKVVIFLLLNSFLTSTAYAGIGGAVSRTADWNDEYWAVSWTCSTNWVAGENNSKTIIENLGYGTNAIDGISTTTNDEINSGFFSVVIGTSRNGSESHITMGVHPDSFELATKQAISRIPGQAFGAVYDRVLYEGSFNACDEGAGNAHASSNLDDSSTSDDGGTEQEIIVNDKIIIAYQPPKSGLYWVTTEGPSSHFIADTEVELNAIEIPNITMEFANSGATTQYSRSITYTSKLLVDGEWQETTFEGCPFADIKFNWTKDTGIAKGGVEHFFEVIPIEDALIDLEVGIHRCDVKILPWEEYSTLTYSIKIKNQVPDDIFILSSNHEEYTCKAAYFPKGTLSPSVTYDHYTNKRIVHDLPYDIYQEHQQELGSGFVDMEAMLNAFNPYWDKYLLVVDLLANSSNLDTSGIISYEIIDPNNLLYLNENGRVIQNPTSGSSTYHSQGGGMNVESKHLSDSDTTELDDMPYIIPQRFDPIREEQRLGFTKQVRVRFRNICSLVYNQENFSPGDNKVYLKFFVTVSGGGKTEIASIPINYQFTSIDTFKKTFQPILSGPENVATIVDYQTPIKRDSFGGGYGESGERWLYKLDLQSNIIENQGYPFQEINFSPTTLEGVPVYFSTLWQNPSGSAGGSPTDLIAQHPDYVYNGFVDGINGEISHGSNANGKAFFHRYISQVEEEYLQKQQADNQVKVGLFLDGTSNKYHDGSYIYLDVDRTKLPTGTYTLTLPIYDQWGDVLRNLSIPIKNTLTDHERDNDSDGIPNYRDKCPELFSTNSDIDGDGFGDECDLDNNNDGLDDSYTLSPTGNVDSDDIVNGADNCPYNTNPSQVDTDTDGLGDACDSDDDGDGVLDNVDVFRTNASASLDWDFDGKPDNWLASCDVACQLASGLELDSDDDNDGISDTDDAFAYNSTASTDSDNDGKPNNFHISCDSNCQLYSGLILDNDDDNDGVDDLSDDFPIDKASSIDTDGDGMPDIFHENCDVICISESGLILDEDDDNDGVDDTFDAFPLDASESIDTDADGQGNNTDIDDDNDGIVDDKDVAPLDSSVGDTQAPIFSEPEVVVIEATGVATTIELVTPNVTDDNLNAPTITSNYSGTFALGEHEVIWTATDFAGNTSTATQSVTVVDTVGPVFDELSIKTIDARGYLTNVLNDIEVYAVDAVDGQVSAVIGDSFFPSGVHTVYLIAEDKSGNKSQSEIIVHINPLVELGQDESVEAGTNYRASIQLSSLAAVYPVSISYHLQGPISSDESGELVFNEEMEPTIEFSISETAQIGDTVVLSLVTATNAVLSEDTELVLNIVELNHPPTVDIKISQKGKSVSIIDTKGGLVTVDLEVKDVNLLDVHEITWISADNQINDSVLDEQASTFEFEPELLSSGVYTLAAKITENNTSDLYEVTTTVNLVHDSVLVELRNEADSDNDGISDLEEGYADSDQDGISDYLDDDSNTSRLPLGNNIGLMQTLNGLKLSLGEISLSVKGAMRTSASINEDDIAEYDVTIGTQVNNWRDADYDALSTMTNFTISGLSYEGESVPVVIPLSLGKFIPEYAVYRKYMTTKGWFDFVVDDHNTIFSALTDRDGNCPAPISIQYVEGLNVGDNCIQLLIEDGGENDADGKVNGIIEDPGVLASIKINQQPIIDLASTLEVDENNIVTLNASNTFDAEDDQLTFLWTQTSGISVVIAEKNSSVMSFTSPKVSTDEILTFELSVSDGIDIVTATINVTILNVNTAPTLSIDFHPATVNEGSSISLPSISLDPDGDVVTYLWEQTSGPIATLIDSETSTITFTAPQVDSDQTIVLTLTASDGELETVASISLVVNNVVTPTTTPTPNDSGSSGGAIGWLVLLVLFELYRKLTLAIRYKS